MPGLTLLVDSSSLIYRSYFALPDSIRARDGSVVNAAYGFLSMLERLVTDLRPTRLACCLDADWRPDWRVDLLPEYKSHRVALAEEQIDEWVEPQTDVVLHVLKLARVAAVGAADCEAEDVIATIAKRTRGNVAVVSGDRDLFQLVHDPSVWVLYPKRGVSDLLRVDEAEIRKRYGIDGRRYHDFAVLRGDPSDGLPGVPGIGEKTATLLVAKYGELPEILKAADGAKSGPLAKVAAHADYVRRASEVVRLKTDADIGDPDLTVGGAPSSSLKKVARDYGLNGPVDRLVASLQRAAKRA